MNIKFKKVKLSPLSQTKEVLIPHNWTLKKIKDIGQIDPEIINQKEYNNTEIEYVDIGSISDYKIEATQTISFKERPSRAKKILRKNDVIISTVRPYLRSFSIIKNEIKNLVGSTGFAVIRTNDIFDSRWIFYFSQSNHFLTHMIRFMQGSNYPAVTSDIVGNTLIPYPNNPKEKEKIITILLNIDDLIQKQKQVIIQTQKLLKAQSYSLLTKGIGYTDSELVEIKYGQRWMIEKFPKNWKPTSLSKLCKIRKNEDLSSNTYVGLENIQDDGNNNLISKEDSSLFSSTKIFKEGDVLYGKLRPYLNKIWLATEEGYCSTDILPLVVNEKIDNVFLLNVLRSKLFLNYAISTSSGTKMPRIEWSDIQKFVIALPPTIEEQEKIASILSNLDSLIKQEKQYKEKLEKIKRGLMQQLLTGQTRVKV